MVGLAHHLRIFDPYSKLNPIDWYLANRLEKAFNWTIPNALITGKIEVAVPTLVSYRQDVPEAINTQDFLE